MDSDSVIGVRRVKVYFRNQQKRARIMQLPQVMPAKQVYQLVSSSYNVRIDGLHLFYGGELIKKQSQMRLVENSIVHMVNLDELKDELFTVSVKKIGGKINAVEFQTTGETKIKDFIDQKLSIVYGQKSDAVFLVHMGRQLALQKTFREEQVQMNAELLCLQFESQQQKQKSGLELQGEPKHEYMVNVRLKSQSDIKLPKNIYPQQNFTIETPNDLDSTFQLKLIFDAKVRKSSSIQDIDFNPAETIEEEDYFEEEGQGERVTKSLGPNSEKKQSEEMSHFSQKISDSFISLDSRNKKKQSYRTNLSRDNLLYGDSFEIGEQKKHIMQKMLKGYGQIMRKKDGKEKQSE